MAVSSEYVLHKVRGGAFDLAVEVTQIILLLILNMYNIILLHHVRGEKEICKEVKVYSIRQNFLTFI